MRAAVGPGPAEADRRIRALRPAKVAIGARRPLGSQLEPERRPGGRIERALTVFLAGAECPFTCSFCDLWKQTLDGPTPPGALPGQLDLALEERRHTDPAPDRIKLYNASNFFDRRAVPPADHAWLAELAGGAAVTVETHARLVGPACRRFADRLEGRLEVAVGLETAHPAALAGLNKRMTVDDFDRAAAMLRAADLDLRAFVLLGVPGIPEAESVEWTVRSVEHAVAAGAAVVSVIPVRDGNGELDRLRAEGAWRPPTLTELEAVIDAVPAGDRAVVTADLWDADRIATCPECGPARVERLRVWNLGGVRAPRIFCPRCGTDGG